MVDGKTDAASLQETVERNEAGRKLSWLVENQRAAQTEEPVPLCLVSG